MCLEFEYMSPASNLSPQKRSKISWKIWDKRRRCGWIEMWLPYNKYRST
jgi:hypothetical protein